MTRPRTAASIPGSEPGDRGASPRAATTRDQRKELADFLREARQRQKRRDRLARDLEPRIIVPAPLTLPEFDRSHRFRLIEDPRAWEDGHDVTRAELLDAYAAGKEIDEIRSDFEALWVRMLAKLT